MLKIRFRRMEAARRGGTGIFLLLVIVVVIIAGYGVRWWIKRNAADPDTAQGLSPWVEWNLRQSSQKPFPELRQEQPKITESLKYMASAEAMETRDTRGEVHVFISPEDDVWGMWSGNYYDSNKVNCEVQAGRFEGRIHPGKTYQDSNGEDRSRLYFLARGKLVLHMADFDTGKYKICAGEIYVRGWLKPDLSMDGDVTILCSDGYTDNFKIRALRPEKGG
jgi:hypothetical protein